MNRQCLETVILSTCGSGRIVPEYATPDIGEVFEDNDRIIYHTQGSVAAILTVRNFSEALPIDPQSL